LRADVEKEIALTGETTLGRLLTSISVRSAEHSGAGLDPGVHIMSIHKAKGLSAPYVFIPAAERHVIPGLGRLREHELEERRVFFVGITRARSLVVFSIAHKRPKQQGGGNVPVPELTPFLNDTGLRFTTP
jgi:superfamily I DNA/RNA helicase